MTFKSFFVACNHETVTTVTNINDDDDDNNDVMSKWKKDFCVSLLQFFKKKNKKAPVNE